MEEETYYLTIRSSTNGSTLIFSQTYSNVVRVELCYADVPVKKKGEPITLDVEEFRNGFTDEGVDVITSREANSPVRGFFATLPVENEAEGRRIFRETSDYLYGINFPTPLTFTRLTTRILDASGKAGAESGHTMVIRVITRRNPPRPSPPPRQQQSQRPIVLVPQPAQRR